MALTPYPSLATLPEVVRNGGKLPNAYLNPSWISLKWDLGIPDDVSTATLTGVGPTTFGDAAYGTSTLASGPYAGQTVTQAIQHALDLAANGPVGILWDVRCSVGAAATPGNNMVSALTLRRPGNLHILARPGCGTILRAQCNASVFANESPTFGTVISNSGTHQALATIGDIAFGDLTIEGMIINANSGVITSHASAPNQSSPTFGETFYLNCLRMFGVQDVKLIDCKFLGAGGFHTYWGNWQRVLSVGTTVDSLGNGGTQGGNDCYHINGPGDQFTIRDGILRTEDDHLGINCLDGNNSDGSLSGPSVPFFGGITRVRAFNTRLTGTSPTGNFVRVMAANGVAAGGHEFDGIYGTIGSLGYLLISNAYDFAPGGTIGEVHFRNIGIDPSVNGIQTGVPVGRLVVSGSNNRTGSNLAIPLVSVRAACNCLDIDGLRVLDDGTSGTTKHQVEVIEGGSITRFSARDVRLEGNSGNQAMALLNVASGSTVTLADFNGVTSDKVLDLVVNAGTIGTVLGRGVSMTNAGSGALVANSGTWTTSVLSNCDPALTDHTGTAPGSTHGDFYGSGGGGGSPSISLSPATLAVSLTGQTIAVTGTDFTTATTFAMTGLSGSSITGTTINSRTSATLTVTTGSTSGSATITCSDFSTASLAVTAAATTFLDDTFHGTAGTSLTGNTAVPTNNGSDAYGDFTPTFGAMGYASGGVGATSLAMTGGAAFSSYPLAGIGQGGTYTFKFTGAASSAVAAMHIHRADGSNEVAISASFGGGSGPVIDVSTTTGGTTTDHGNVNVTMPTGSVQTLVAALTGTSMAITLDGTPVTTVTVPTGSGTILLIGQSGGTAGDIVFTEVKVTS